MLRGCAAPATARATVGHGRTRRLTVPDCERPWAGRMVTAIAVVGACRSVGATSADHGQRVPVATG